MRKQSISFIAIFLLAASSCIKNVKNVCPVTGIDVWRKPPYGSFEYEIGAQNPFYGCTEGFCSIAKSDLEILLGNFAKCEKTREHMVDYLLFISTEIEPQEPKESLESKL